MHPTLRAPAALASTAAALLLALLTWRVRSAGASLPSDLFWADTLQALHSQQLSALMLAAHRLQGWLVAMSTLLWAGMLAWHRRWAALRLLVIALPGGMLVNVGLKLLIHRPRPALPAAVGAHGFAYPSGHVVAITLFCGCLLLESFRRRPSTAWRGAACIAAAAVVALVAVGRVYLGVHQASDVAAGLLLGVAWLGVCLTAAQAPGRAVGSKTMR